VIKRKDADQYILNTQDNQILQMYFTSIMITLNNVVSEMNKMKLFVSIFFQLDPRMLKQPPPKT
jgi:hypothetical protein